jgi:hypothetical protein
LKRIKPMKADKEAIDGVQHLRQGLHAAMTALLTKGDLKETELILRQLDARFGQWLSRAR